MGPLCLRPLNQNAVSHTFVPASSAVSKFTLILTTRPVEPSNFQSLRSAGEVAPTWLKTDAPKVPGGFPRRAPPASRRRICTVHPLTETISITGLVVGAGIGEGDCRG